MDKHISAGMLMVFPSIKLVKTFNGYRVPGEFATRFRSGNALAAEGERYSICSFMQKHDRPFKFMEVEIPAIPAQSLPRSIDIDSGAFWQRMNRIDKT